MNEEQMLEDAARAYGMSVTQYRMWLACAAHEGAT
jgi:hypothetical protein